jgi:hypothetical protein
MNALLVVALTLSLPAELGSGLYAVLCGKAYPGKNRARAVAACERDKGRASLCSCRQSDFVTIAGGPTKYLDCGKLGRTREAARAACLSATDKWIDCRCGDSSRAIYGPFHRRRVRREYDDDKVYRWLSESGEWVDERGESPCFPSGTLVATPDGPRPIEAISVGDRVLSRDEEGASIVARVTRTKERRANELVVIAFSDGVLRATPNHPLRTPDGWVAAGELAPGQPLVTEEGQRVPISLEIVAADEPVYDLTVEPSHSYFAAGVWVHNY